jgi:hypothetical protein
VVLDYDDKVGALFATLGASDVLLSANDEPDRIITILERQLEGNGRQRGMAILAAAEASFVGIDSELRTLFTHGTRPNSQSAN